MVSDLQQLSDHVYAQYSCLASALLPLYCFYYFGGSCLKYELCWGCGVQHVCMPALIHCPETDNVCAGTRLW